MVTPVGIDNDKLQTWARSVLPQLNPPLRATLVAGGYSCLTYVVTDAVGSTVALLRPPVADLLASAHNVIREYRIIPALSNTTVSVARTLAACEDMKIIGAPFYVMDFVEGVVLYDAAAAF